MQIPQNIKTNLAEKKCLMAEMKESKLFSIAQIEKHFKQVKTIIELPVIAIYNQLEAYNRKRMIEKKWYSLYQTNN